MIPPGTEGPRWEGTEASGSEDKTKCLKWTEVQQQHEIVLVIQSQPAMITKSNSK